MQEVEDTKGTIPDGFARSCMPRCADRFTVPGRGVHRRTGWPQTMYLFERLFRIQGVYHESALFVYIPRREGIRL